MPIEPRAFPASFESHAPVNPAARRPATMGGQSRVSVQTSPDLKFSIITTTGPWLMPKCQGDTQPCGASLAWGNVGLKVALKP